MILYDDNRRTDLRDFGIQIPVAPDRAARSFEKLCTHPLLGPQVARWHCRPDPERIQQQDLLRAHSHEYIERLFSAGLQKEVIQTYELVDPEGHYYRYDPKAARLPLSDLLERVITNLSGTWQCCRLALERGFCYYFGGGLHHAHRDHGSGFCLLNDVVVGLRKLQAQNQIRQAWIIDVDAHKGDGTAAMTAGDRTITTLSVHMAHGWPLHESPRDDRGGLKPAFVPSDVDIPMEADQEHLYTRRLQSGLHRLEGLSRPDIAVVLAGADPFAGDELPSTEDLNLSLVQLMARDRMIYDFLKKSRVPAAYLMAGGYGPRSWEVDYQFLEWVLPRELNTRASHMER